VDRILVDYLLRNGSYETAIKLATDSSVQELVDIDVFLASRKVVDSLRNKDCSTALTWCSDNKIRLKKN